MFFFRCYAQMKKPTGVNGLVWWKCWKKKLSTFLRNSNRTIPLQLDGLRDYCGINSKWKILNEIKLQQSSLRHTTSRIIAGRFARNKQNIKTPLLTHFQVQRTSFLLTCLILPSPEEEICTFWQKIKSLDPCFHSWRSQERKKQGVFLQLKKVIPACFANRYHTQGPSAF